MGCLYVGVIPVLDNRNKSDKVFDNIDEFITAYYLDRTPPITEKVDDAFMLCTSGTTGQTKFVVHSQESICGTGLQFGPYLNITKNDTILSAAKMFHAYGLGNSISIPLSHGCTVILESELPSPIRIVNHIQNHKVTIFCGVPRHYTSLLSVKYGCESLRICLSAGELLPNNVKNSFTLIHNCDIIDSIGSTESLGFMISSGVPVDGCQVKLLNEYGDEVESGNIGELFVSVPFGSYKYKIGRAHV